MLLRHGFAIFAAALIACVVSSSDPSFKVDYDNGQFLLDGQPFRYISGSIHYFRIHPDQWLDRLKRVRALGFNAIQFYVPWNFHEVEKGSYDFSGTRDFVRFAKIAEKLGMYSLLRMGPYACGEWENGGLPYWLLSHYENITQRTNDENFTNEVKTWFEALAPYIRPLLRNNGGPVLMVQIENEYGSYYACDHVYTAWLRDLTLNLLGEQTVLYTTDGDGDDFLKCGAVNGTLATIDFGVTSAKEVRRAFDTQKKYLPGGKGPLVNSEFYPGWLVLWGQTTQSVPSPKDIVGTATAIYDNGASLNFYMIYGGTNFGFWNGAETNAPVITSYDYSAPISESGDYADSYWAIRYWIKGIKGWQNAPTTPPKPSKKLAYETVKMTRTLSILATPKKECTQSDEPISFEKMGQQFGYLLYFTKLKTCGTNLTIPIIKDFGYVFISGRQKETFVKEFNDIKVNSILLDECKEGDELQILVENQGRLTYKTINDYKGILSSVYLDGNVIKGWTQCTVDGPYELAHGTDHELNVDDQQKLPSYMGKSGLYVGRFNVEEVADTWLVMKNWSKGNVVVNGKNIGRHWSKVGPQYNLYVPAPLLKKGQNTISVKELIGVEGCTDEYCEISFSTTPDIHFKDDNNVKNHHLPHKKHTFPRRRRVDHRHRRG